MPWMWLIAGPNGSGKSTMVDEGLLEAITTEPLYKLNADVKARELRKADLSLEPAAANLSAAQYIDAEVDRLISEGHSFAVETALASDKYKSRIESAKTLGFNIGFIYVTLATAEDNIDRVKERVLLGGHSVSSEKIRSRWERSISNMAWFVERADFVLIFDNTAPGLPSPNPVLLASKLVGGNLQLWRSGYHPRVEAELEFLVDKGKA